MMYTDEVNAQLLLALLKKYGIRKAVLSPGTTNVAVSGSMTMDPWFEAYSAYDERSAAYMACGLAAASGEPVLLSCTGATASRDYMPGLTEAYYRKLPVLAVTSMHDIRGVGNLEPQVIDRSSVPNDIATFSTTVDVVRNAKDRAYARLQICQAIAALSAGGGGPSHIQLISECSGKFTTPELPDVEPIRTLGVLDEWPAIEQGRRIAVIVGAHGEFSSKERSALNSFLSSHDAVALVDKSSGYHGGFTVESSLACSQFGIRKATGTDLEPDLVIHVGEVSGDYPTHDFIKSKKHEVWRVSPDGRMAERFGELRYVFQADLETFFSRYASGADTLHPYFEAWQSYDSSVRKRIPELPFSSYWIAQMLSDRLPEGSTAHLGILNSLRAWNYFPVNPSIATSANTGGFGIDGAMSTLIGASLAAPNTPHFLFIGDLAFFYDMNALGNRHLGPNVHILLANNGSGVEFKRETHIGYQFGSRTDDYIAAGGHNAPGDPDGPTPAQGWASSLGLSYLRASSKEEFLNQVESFLSFDAESPMLFECILDPFAENDAYMALRSIDPAPNERLKKAAKAALPDCAVAFAKRLVR